MLKYLPDTQVLQKVPFDCKVHDKQSTIAAPHDWQSERLAVKYNPVVSLHTHNRLESRM